MRAPPETTELEGVLDADGVAEAEADCVTEGEAEADGVTEGEGEGEAEGDPPFINCAKGVWLGVGITDPGTVS